MAELTKPSAALQAITEWHEKKLPLERLLLVLNNSTHESIEQALRDYMVRCYLDGYRQCQEDYPSNDYL